MNAGQSDTPASLSGQHLVSGVSPLRIAYLARWEVGAESGVLKKINEQLRTWCAMGHEAKLFVLSPTLRPWRGLDGVPIEVVSSASTHGRERAMRELLVRALAWQPDVAYIRYATHYFALEAFMERVPTVLELNTDDRSEYKLYLPRHKYWYHLATRGRILRRAAGFVSVTHEIASRFTAFDKPIRTIGNSADLSAYPPLPPADNTNTRAVFIGSAGSPWHGVDKIVTLAGQLPEWHFDLIGPSLDVESVPPNITMHGVIGREEYECVLERADVAIGSLALHRNRMDEACPLKLREYLAYGLPCINGYRDTDFPESVPFLLELPNTPDNVVRAVAEIRDFGERWRGRRVARESVLHLDVRSKEVQRVEFMAEARASR
jgi:hypothetical protein